MLMSLPAKHEIVVYLLNCDGSNRTYIGYSTNLAKRLRQHAGELVGGARSTRGHCWTLVGYIQGFTDKGHAMSVEWKAKRVHGVRARISLMKALAVEHGLQFV
jgi:putative endonuclease